MENKSDKNWWLYVLELEDGKYYVGITSKTPEERFKQHKNGFLAANWTKKYKPIRIFDTKDLGLLSLDQAQEYEGNVTRKYMEKYGYNNVRGGDLVDDEEYLSRFNRYITKSDWEILTVLILQNIAIIALLLSYYDLI